MATEWEELQPLADEIDALPPVVGRSPLTLAVVQRVVERGARAAKRRAVDVPEDAPTKLEQHVGCLRPLESSRDIEDVWSRWGAYDGATQGWAGVHVGRSGCPTPACVALYGAHFYFAAGVVQRVRSET